MRIARPRVRGTWMRCLIHRFPFPHPVTHLTRFAGLLLVTLSPAAVLAADSTVAAMDPLVAASPYRDQKVWSYHDKDPVPWARFHPRDFGASTVAFSAAGVRPVGRVPAPGVHPRIFFSSEDLPALRRRLKEDRGGQEAWKNILAWTNTLKLTYDEKADYAQPDWSKGGFGVHGRFGDLSRIGGYSPRRENYFQILADGGHPAYFEKTPPAEFFKAAATEAFRCLIDDDAPAARTLIKATLTAMRLEQERRAKEDKPVAAGQPPQPSTSRSNSCALGFIYDFTFNWMTPAERNLVRTELVLLSAWADNYGTFNNAEASRSNWATFSYWVFDLMAIEGEPGFNDLKFLGLYRGWRNFYTYSFFESGAAFEGEGKLLLGLDAVVAMDRVGDKYGLEPLSQHPLPRAYNGKFSAYSLLPTRDAFAVFDILGGVSKPRGSGLTTPNDLVVARWLYPEDKTTDFVYRAMVSDDYSTLPASLHFHWHMALTSAIFAIAYTPEVSPETLGLAPTFFCGQRGLLMTRSSWQKDATFLTMHVRGASGGHPYPDRNGLMLTGQGRAWVTIPGKDIGGWAMNSVLIDEAEQNATTPARVVDFVDQPDATFMVGDAQYSWDWAWNSTARNRDGGGITREDVLADRLNTGRGWHPVEQSFNDFAWLKRDNPVFSRPQKFNTSWIGFDGLLNPATRQVNTPVLRSFRTAGLVRGPHPYVLVVDDIERDGLPARYDWNLTLEPDVVAVPASAKLGVAGDILLVGKASLDEKGAPKKGEPALLVRLLEARGERLPDFLGAREKMNLLSLRVRAPAPNFKVLLHAFRIGDPLPTTTWQPKERKLAVVFPDQRDVIAFEPAASGKTDVILTRAGRELAAVRRPVAPLADPSSAALTARLRELPARCAALRTARFTPERLAGFLAAWDFSTPKAGAFPALPGSIPQAPALPAAPGRAVPGPGGRSAFQCDATGLKVMLPAEVVPPDKQPFSVAFWVRTKANPEMGNVLSLGSKDGFAFDIVQGALRFSAAGQWGFASLPTSMLGRWTHFAVTYDGAKLSLYRDGFLIVQDAAGDRPPRLGRELRLGGTSNNGDAEPTFAGLSLYNGALSAEDVLRLMLHNRLTGGL